MIAYLKYRYSLIRAFFQYYLEYNHENRVERYEWRKALITLVYDDSKLRD